MQSIHNLKEMKLQKTDRRGKTETWSSKKVVSVFILVRFEASNPVDRRFECLLGSISKLIFWNC